MSKSRRKYINNSKDSKKITPEKIFSEAKEHYERGGEDQLIRHMQYLKEIGIISEWQSNITIYGHFLTFILDDIDYRFCLEEIDVRKLQSAELLDIEFEVKEKWREYAKKRKKFWEEYRRGGGK